MEGALPLFGEALSLSLATAADFGGLAEGPGSMSTKAGMRSSRRECQMSTLIVAHPGPLRDGVEALLASVPRVKVLVEEASVEGAMRKAARPVDLLLVDGSYSEGEIRRLLKRCLATCPEMRSIVYANNARQTQQAYRLDVDAVFMTGRPADQFVRMVEELLQEG